jgi:hypothetical protein
MKTRIRPRKPSHSFYTAKKVCLSKGDGLMFSIFSNKERNERLEKGQA